jgi:site-specific DNA recombinase
LASFLRAAASRADLRNLIDRTTIGRAAIQVQLSEAVEGAEANVGPRNLTLPWTPPSPYRRREIIQGVADGTNARPIRANGRAILIDALRDAHRWLNELLTVQTLESLALREGKTDRSIRMTLSLAFLAPDIVKAAVEGRLPEVTASSVSSIFR